MSRGRVDSAPDMRGRIIDAAVAVIAEDGLAASTATIAKRAGVAQGSVFHHFGTKHGLLDAVFRHLKSELGAVVLRGLPRAQEPVGQLNLIWTRWIDWGIANPTKRRALFLIESSDQVADETRDEAARTLAGGVEIFRDATARGPLKDQPIEFIGALVYALINSTMDMMALHPNRADNFREAGYQAMLNMLR